MVEAFESWLREQYAKLSPNNQVAKAIAYSLNCWDALLRFLDDGRLCLSNNAAEWALRGIAVGPRNWTFAGSDEGGAAAYTLIETAKLNDVDPVLALQDMAWLSAAPHRGWSIYAGPNHSPLNWGGSEGYGSVPGARATDGGSKRSTPNAAESLPYSDALVVNFQ